MDTFYPIVYLDCMHVKVKVSDGSVRVKAVYLANGINMSGEKEVLGLWIAQTPFTHTQNSGDAQM